jgi:hypothetical protein
MPVLTCLNCGLSAITENGGIYKAGAKPELSVFRVDQEQDVGGIRR